MRVFSALLVTAIFATLTYVGAAQAATSSLSSCTMASEGIFQGSWVKHRIVVDEDTLAGANDMDSILSQLEDLRSEGLCR
ncbi:MAG: hypothetical protein HUU57_15475 [Bdellovibrio sp.]|nr:hypothetical protein [Bdellovibrio sp.]